VPGIKSFRLVSQRPFSNGDPDHGAALRAEGPVDRSIKPIWAISDRIAQTYGITARESKFWRLRFVLWRRKLIQPVRPVARDDAADLVVHLCDVVEAFLDSRVTDAALSFRASAV